LTSSEPVQRQFCGNLKNYDMTIEKIDLIELTSQIC
jgi:hypothetical protein